MRGRRKRRLNCGRMMCGLSFLVVLAVGCFLWSGYKFLSEEFPDVSALKGQYPVVHYKGTKVPPQVTLQKGRPQGWTTLGEISRVAVGAVLVSEDSAFYQHKGYDAVQIKEAIKEDWEEGRFVRGASTITQQVVRNVFLSKDKNIWRKVKELILAVRIEQHVTKRRILETYFNIAEWGEGIFGIRAAASYYFHKSPAELTAKEGAFLAMLLPSPKRYSQSFRKRSLTDYAQDTVRDLLKKLTQTHYITEEDRVREMETPLSFEAIAELPAPDASGVPQGVPSPEISPEEMPSDPHDKRTIDSET